MGRTEKKKSNLNYGKILAIIVVIIISVIIVVATRRKDVTQDQQPQVETYKEEEDGTKFNTSEKLQETKVFENYEISNTAISKKDGETQFSAKIKNVSDTVIGNESVYIIFKSISGEELYRMEVYLSEIQPGKSTTINSKITIDVVESYDIELKKK